MPQVKLARHSGSSAKMSWCQNFLCQEYPQALSAQTIVSHILPTVQCCHTYRCVKVHVRNVAGGKTHAYRHMGSKTVQTRDTSAPLPKCPPPLPKCPRTLPQQDISALRHFSLNAEKVRTTGPDTSVFGSRHSDTSAEVSSYCDT